MVTRKAATKKTSATKNAKPAAKKSTPKKTAKATPSAKATKAGAPTKKPKSASPSVSRNETKASAKPSAKPAANPKKYEQRADFGAPVDAFFAKQPEATRAILETLRKLVEQAAPDAVAGLKWGMPTYSVGTTLMCALGGHKAHVNLVLSGPPGTYDDPRGLLEGEGKTGKHLRITTLEGFPAADVKRWLTTAAARARAAS